MFVGPIEEQRFVDVEENAVYWYFVVLAWLPIYGVIYWAPRLTVDAGDVAGCRRCRCGPAFSPDPSPGRSI